MMLIQNNEGKWFNEATGEALTHVPKTRKCEHLLNAAGEVAAKRCGGSCGEILPLDSFNKCGKGFAKKRSYCKACERMRLEANAKGTDIYGKRKRPIKPKAEREYDENGVCVRKVCPKCGIWRERDAYYPLSSVSDGLGTHCRPCVGGIMRDAAAKDPERYKTYGHNRRAKEAALLGDLTDEQWKATLEHFGGACAVTGATDDLHLEHAIPIAIGHAGTVAYNCYPMYGSLNNSKGAKNIFDWVRGRTDVEKPKFNRLIAYLADKCGLTVDEYKEFVTWCFSNPRLTVEEIRADGDVDSLELWRRSVSRNAENVA